MNRMPLFTLLLCSLAGSLMFLPSAAHEVLYFDYRILSAGNWLGLISGHWVHADASHLLWNVSALAVLAGLIEARSRRLLAWSILVGMVSVDLLLLSPLSDLQRYCGLSGLLNTLLGVVLYLVWRKTRSRIVITVGLACLAKIALEIYFGQSVFTDITWPPFAMAHLAGMLGAPLAVAFGDRIRSEHSTLKNKKRTHHGHLVSG